MSVDSIIGLYIGLAFVGLPLAIWLDWIVAKKAASKGYEFSTFFILGIFISPLLLWLVVTLITTKEPELLLEDESGKFAFKGSVLLVKCPRCAEYIKPEAKVCRFCHSEVEKSIQSELKARAEGHTILAAKQSAEAELRKATEAREREELRANRRELLNSKKFRITAIVVFVAVLGVVGTIVTTTVQNNQIWESNQNAIISARNACAKETTSINLSFESSENHRLVSFERIDKLGKYRAPVIECMLAKLTGSVSLLAIGKGRSEDLVFQFDGLNFSWDDPSVKLPVTKSSPWSDYERLLTKCNVKMGFNLSVVVGKPTLNIYPNKGSSPVISDIDHMPMPQVECLTRSALGKLPGDLSEWQDWGYSKYFSASDTGIRLGPLE